MRRFVLSLALCYFVLMFFSPFSIAITSLGEERANLSAFLTFVRFELVWLCLSSSSLCLGRTAACDCGISWTFLLPFFSIPARSVEIYHEIFSMVIFPNLLIQERQVLVSGF